jgi:hypothetical protein
MTQAVIDNWVDQAFAQKKWLIISFHSIVDKTKITDPQTLLYSTDIKDFEKLVDYITVKSLVSAYENTP